MSGYCLLAQRVRGLRALGWYIIEDHLYRPSTTASHCSGDPSQLFCSSQFTVWLHSRPRKVKRMNYTNTTKAQIHKSTNTQKHKYNGLMSAATCRASPNPDPDIWCEMQLKQGVQIQPNWTLNRGSTPPKCENYFCFTFISVTGLRSFLRLLVENGLWLFNQMS